MSPVWQDFEAQCPACEGRGYVTQDIDQHLRRYINQPVEDREHPCDDCDSTGTVAVPERKWCEFHHHYDETAACTCPRIAMAESSFGGGVRAGRDHLPDLDPITPTRIAPGLVALPLAPTVWDDLPDGQHALTADGTVWVRRAGLWHRDPWWQGVDADDLLAICGSPGSWAYDMGWPRHHIEDTHRQLTPITLPGGRGANE